MTSRTDAAETHAAMIAYCSPAGATRHVARVIEETVERMGGQATTCDLGGGDDPAPIHEMIKKAQGNGCLFIGSPVYVSHTVPPVMDFIKNLPEGGGLWAVPFVTWGGVCSGMALYEMGKALTEKGYRLGGGAKVGAVHSSLWRSDFPLGEGHPDDGDDEKVQELVHGVYDKLAEGNGRALPLADLDYQPPDLRKDMEKMSLETAKAHIPKRKVNQSECTECGVCAEVCPTEAVALTPYPEFNDNCIYCFSCVRECPEEAIKIDLTQTESRLRSMAEKIGEKPFTRVFL